MRTHTPLFVLAALGAITVATPAAAVDTSAWKCETCPYPSGVSGTVEVGLGHVSDASARFGDYTGLQKKGSHLVLGGSATIRGAGGYYADLDAADLGLDSRSLSARSGREGLYALRLGYSEIPRHFADGAFSPFLGIGTNVLTLPAVPGFPAGTTAGMPLASTLQPVDPGFKRSRFDLGGSYLGGDRWSVQADFRRDIRDGTRISSASFFSTASQLLAPVDHVTDQLELSASYSTRLLQATLGYRLSQFSNQDASLVWSNPFTPVVPGSGRGQLALAPDNRFQQIFGSAAYQVAPTIRASAEFALGRMTQDADYLASTLNPTLVVPALPARSLDGVVDTFSGSVRVTATPVPELRLTAAYMRDVRDNRTGVLRYPTVATDMFLSTTSVGNTPFGYWQDRFKLSADFRGPGLWRVAGGIEQDNRERSYSEVVTTRETTFWGRASVQARENLSLSAKVLHAERVNSPYGVATWFGTSENPLLRKYNLASRNRNSGSVRADFAVTEAIALGFSADLANDDYARSAIGLTQARSSTLGVDLSVAVSEGLQITAFAQGERIRSSQAGSLSSAAPDWTGRVKDRFEVAGAGLKYAAIPDKLDVGADLTFARASSQADVQTGVGEPSFPAVKTLRDSVRFYANYKLDSKMTLSGTYGYENHEAQDWRLDGVLPATLPDLLALGQQSPNYRIHLVRVSLRYRF